MAMEDSMGHLDREIDAAKRTPRCTCEPPALFCPNHGDDRQLGEPTTLTRHERRYLEQRIRGAAHG